MLNKDRSQKRESIYAITLFIITIIWGSSFVVTEFAFGAGLTPLFILMCRFSIAAVFIGLFYARHIRQTFRLVYLRQGIILGSIFFLAFYTSLLGLKYSSPSNNAIITSTNVIIVPLIWWLKTKTKPVRGTFISCAVSFIGLLIITLDFSQELTLHLGDVFSLISALMFAVQIVFVGEISQAIDYRVLVFIEFLTAAVLSTIIFLITDRVAYHFTNMGGLFSLFYLGLVCTCFCFLLQAFAMHHVNPTRGAVIMSTEALFGSMISIAVGYDTLSWRIVSGGLLITFAVILPVIWPTMKPKRITI